MRIDINIDFKPHSAIDCFPKTTITAHGQKEYFCELRVEYKPFLYRLGHPTELEMDLLFFGSVIYAIDKLVPRSESFDNWQRLFDIQLPVADTDLWGQASETIERALNFLTGDTWALQPIRREEPLWYPMQRRPRKLVPLPKAGISMVSLFSGGLDSLVGIIDVLEELNGKVLCISHHDQSGAFSDQNRLLPSLKTNYSGRIEAIQAYIGTRCAGNETSLRSRSIVFLTLGTYCASRRGLSELLVPENGMIALNPPLTPSRRGACSTRTAHPHFLSTFQKALRELGFDISFRNPYKFKTKGEIVAGCRNLDFLKTVALDSVSCGKRGHRRTWLRRMQNVRGCGMCIPCLYRRAALHSINLDTETYGIDVLSGELDISSNLEHTYDFRDIISFLNESHDVGAIRRILVAGGLKDFDHLAEYAEVVLRSKGELIAWIKDKASPHLLRSWRLL